MEASIALLVPGAMLSTGVIMPTEYRLAPMPPMWIFYVNVNDLDGAIARATKLGAKVLNGPMEVPGGAHVAQLMDPQGAPFAMHELAKAKK